MVTNIHDNGSMFTFRENVHHSKISPDEKRMKTEIVDIDLTLDSSPGSEDGEKATQFTEDGSPIFRNEAVTLAEAAEILLQSKPIHRLACMHVPQIGAKDQKAVTFLLDLGAFPEKLQAGDIACDGYEPWDGIRGTWNVCPLTLYARALQLHCQPIPIFLVWSDQSR